MFVSAALVINAFIFLYLLVTALTDDDKGPELDAAVIIFAAVASLNCVALLYFFWG